MSLECQTIGLAAAFQGVRLALDIARDGRCDEAAEARSLASVLALDAGSAMEIYGGSTGLRVGLQALVAQLDDIGRDVAMTRAVATVLHLERKLARRPALVAALRRGLLTAVDSAAQRGELDAELGSELADIYVATVSTLRPRVMIPGNCLHLRQPRHVARIRALLLAAVRGALLWRQKGGSSLRFLLRRRQVADIARQLLAREGSVET